MEQPPVSTRPCEYRRLWVDIRLPASERIYVFTFSEALLLLQVKMIRTTHWISFPVAQTSSDLERDAKRGLPGH